MLVRVHATVGIRARRRPAAERHPERREGSDGAIRVGGLWGGNRFPPEVMASILPARRGPLLLHDDPQVLARLCDVRVVSRQELLEDAQRAL
jgi:hypothetical protein